MIKNEWIVLALCAFSLGGFAVDYTWTGAGAGSDGSYASPFENPGNYSNGDGYPATGDVIVIPADTDLAITNRVDLDWLKRLSRVKPEAETSRLIITVPSGETWTNSCPMSAVNLAAPGSSDFVKGELVKRGDGALLLDAGDKMLNVKSTLYDFWTGLTAEKGDLLLPQDVTANSRYYGYVTVNEGARFFTIRRTDYSKSTHTTYVRGIFGHGVITNSDETTGTPYQLQVMPISGRRDSEFHGSIGGLYLSVNLYNNGGNISLLGTNNTYGSATLLMGGKMYAKSIGMIGNPSSTGKARRINFQPNSASRLVYLGTGETTDKEFCSYQNTSSPAYIDGGEHGGLRLTGQIQTDSVRDTTRTVVFAGNHTNECVIDCTLYGRYWSSGNNPTFYDQSYYAKEGSGTWRVTHHAGRKVPNGWAVREGTLKYDSLDEKGSVCSLGTATNLTSGIANDQVDYAFCLGSTNSGVAEAVFAYSGTSEYSVSTRPIALIGDATFRNDSSKAIRFAGADALVSGLKILTLDGNGGAAQTNEFADISDGNGKLGVTKKGSATWVFGGDQTFTGPLDVQGGTLIVRKIADPKYTWFRLTLMEQHAKTNAEGVVVNAPTYPHINSFALLDSAGAWQNEGIGFMEDSVATLPPGQCTWQNVWGVKCEKQSDTTSTSPDKMFVKSTNYGAFIYPKFGTTTLRPEPSDPNSWPRLILRLSGNAKEIASHDIMNVWGSGTMQKCVKSYTLDGSVDGLHWEEIARTNNLPVAAASWTWSYRNTTGNPNPHTGGAPVDRGSSTRTWHVLEGGNTVSVAPGAKIVADGDITLSSIKLAAAGGGTIEGFSFAESGTIDVTGWNGSHEEIPLNFSNAANLSNVSGWNLKIGGAASSRRFAVSTTGVRLLERGLRLSFR